MEELDLLKKDWQKEDAFAQVSEQDIYGMLQKKSSSIVKWIFYVSLIELGLGFLVGLILSFTKYEEESTNFINKLGIYNYTLCFNIILYVVIFYFILRFYKMYRKISVTSNAKELIVDILKTRKVVKQYIAFNLTSFAILLILAGSYGVYRGYMDIAIKNGDLHPHLPLTFILISGLILVVATGIMTFVFWFVYKLIYGALLKKLQKNHMELKKIDL